MKSAFTAHGHDWTQHTPGDPMPCEPDDEIHVLLCQGDEETRPSFAQPASFWWWNTNLILGWRYATPQPEQPDELATLRALLGRAATSLRKLSNYHNEDCDWLNLAGAPCNCGADEAKALIAEIDVFLPSLKNNSLRCCNNPTLGYS